MEDLIIVNEGKYLKAYAIVAEANIPDLKKDLASDFQELPVDQQTGILAGLMTALHEGLTDIHGKGKIHHDVKLENLMVGADGKIQLSDFGNTRKEDEDFKLEKYHAHYTAGFKDLINTSLHDSTSAVLSILSLVTGIKPGQSNNALKDILVKAKDLTDYNKLDEQIAWYQTSLLEKIPDVSEQCAQLLGGTKDDYQKYLLALVGDNVFLPKELKPSSNTNALTMSQAATQFPGLVKNFTEKAEDLEVKALAAYQVTLNSKKEAGLKMKLQQKEKNFFQGMTTTQKYNYVAKNIDEALAKLRANPSEPELLKKLLTGMPRYEIDKGFWGKDKEQKVARKKIKDALKATLTEHPQLSRDQNLKEFVNRIKISSRREDDTKSSVVKALKNAETSARTVPKTGARTVPKTGARTVPKTVPITATHDNLSASFATVPGTAFMNKAGKTAEIVDQLKLPKGEYGKGTTIGDLLQKDGESTSMTVAELNRGYPKYFQFLKLTLRSERERIDLTQYPIGLDCDITVGPNQTVTSDPLAGKRGAFRVFKQEDETGNPVFLEVQNVVTAADASRDNLKNENS